MKWLRPGPSPHRTALAMIGARAGNRVLLIGASDGALAASVAALTGLNGRTLVVDDAPTARAAAERAAGRAGVLVEFEVAPATQLPAEDASFDIVAIQRTLSAPADEAAPAVCTESRRALRPGGRVLAVEAAPAGRLGLARRPPDPESAARTTARLTAAGFRAVRVVGEAEGVTYIEGLNPRS